LIVETALYRDFRALLNIGHANRMQIQLENGDGTPKRGARGEMCRWWHERILNIQMPSSQQPPSSETCSFDPQIAERGLAVAGQRDFRRQFATTDRLLVLSSRSFLDIE
jgi:hypothetical protein